MIEELKLERVTRTMWETMRVHLLHEYSLSPNLKKKDKPKRVTDLFRLSWDSPKQNNVVEQTLKQQKFMLKALHAAFDKKGKRKRKEEKGEEQSG